MTQRSCRVRLRVEPNLGVTFQNAQKTDVASRRCGWGSQEFCAAAYDSATDEP